MVKQKQRVLYLTIKDLKDLGILQNHNDELIDAVTKKVMTIENLLSRKRIQRSKRSGKKSFTKGSAKLKALKERRGEGIRGTSDHMRGFGTSTPINSTNTSIQTELLNAELRQKTKEEHDRKLLQLENNVAQNEVTLRQQQQQLQLENRFDYNNNPTLQRLQIGYDEMKEDNDQTSQFMMRERQNFYERLNDIDRHINTFQTPQKAYDEYDSIGINTPVFTNIADIFENGGDANQQEPPSRYLSTPPDTRIYATEQPEEPEQSQNQNGYLPQEVTLKESQFKDLYPQQEEKEMSNPLNQDVTLAKSVKEIVAETEKKLNKKKKKKKAVEFIEDDEVMQPILGSPLKENTEEKELGSLRLDPTISPAVFNQAQGTLYLPKRFVPIKNQSELKEKMNGLKKDLIVFKVLTRIERLSLNNLSLAKLIDLAESKNGINIEYYFPLKKKGN